MSKPHIFKVRCTGLWYVSPTGKDDWSYYTTTGTGKTIRDAWQTMELRVKAAELRKAGELLKAGEFSQGWEWRTLATGSRKGQRVLCRWTLNWGWEYLAGGKAHVLLADVEPIQSEPSRPQDSILETQPQLPYSVVGLYSVEGYSPDIAPPQGCTQNQSQHPTDWDVSEALDWHEARRADASPTQPEAADPHTGGSTVRLSLHQHR